MVSPELIQDLKAARRRMTSEVWQEMAATLAAMPSAPDRATIRKATASLLSQDAAWILSESFRRHVSATWCEIAAAMVAVECLAGDTAPLAEIIWTGPANQKFSVRRIDQVLYDLVSKARQRIILVTFAAHRIPHLCDHLGVATSRGVKLTLIVESEGESEGQLTHDAIAAFRDVPAGKTNIHYWPLDQRERNQAGRPGKLHMKCAIVDDVALIGSANLTDDAFNRNMELGVLIREMETVKALVEHLNELISRGVLRKASKP